MKKTMGYILIILGIVAIIGGVMLLTREKAPQETPLAETQTNDESFASHELETITDEPEVVTEGENRVIENEATEQVADVDDSQDEMKEIGNSFEDFVVNLLADYRLTLLDRTQDAVSSAGVIAESCKNPDLHVQQKRGNLKIDYYLECKYRTHWTNDVVAFEDWQLDRYRQFQRDNRRKVLIALGVGGTPDAPATFRIVPLDSIKRNSIRKIDTKYAVDPTPSGLIGYMNTYFSSVFEKSKYRNK